MRTDGFYLWSHSWKSFIRNERWRRSLAARILYLLVGIYFVALFAALGYAIASALAQEGAGATGKFLKWIIIYMLTDYLARTLLQQVPSMEVIPYMRFRIRRRRLVSNMIVRSFRSLFNFLPLLMLIPFLIRVAVPSEGIMPALLLLAGCLLLIFMNNLLALLTIMLTRLSPLFWLIPAAVAGSLAWEVAGAVELAEGITIRAGELSLTMGQSMMRGDPVFFLVVITVITLAFILISHLFHRFLRLDRRTGRFAPLTARQHRTRDFAHQGSIRSYMSLETAMLLRNRRPRNMLLQVPIFMSFFIIIFYFHETHENIFYDLMVPTMLIGLGVNYYGQLIFSWESSYFDGLTARRLNLLNYLKAKYYLQLIMIVLSYIPVAIVTLITGKSGILLVTAIALSVAGPVCLVILWLATLNDGRVDLEAGTFMNWEGVRGSQFITAFLLILIPTGIFALTRKYAGDNAGMAVLAGTGLLFILLHNWWLEHLVAARFMKRRYKLLERYRKLSA